MPSLSGGYLSLQLLLGGGLLRWLLLCGSLLLQGLAQAEGVVQVRSEDSADLVVELLVLLQLVARGLVSGGRSLLLGQLGIEWLGLVLGLGLTALMKCFWLLPGGVLLDG